MNRLCVVIAVAILVQASLIFMYIAYSRPPKVRTNWNFISSRNRTRTGSPPIPQDYRKLLNIDGFNLTTPVHRPCGALRLLILVVSAPKHQNLRQTIRETWANVTDSAALFFMVGSTD
ncbi:uncharacterized protein LOC132698106 [Cylas formicarius]|uniref:uncharacterized protein LOC132698106 n=1 Tax=Cylas formicarius TaxID=197179 RepID=UPI0029587CB5|nr:uncharacterized protein LOC132698106 [Cylas formicarius]